MKLTLANFDKAREGINNSPPCTADRLILSPEASEIIQRGKDSKRAGSVKGQNPHTRGSFAALFWGVGFEYREGE